MSLPLLLSVIVASSPVEAPTAHPYATRALIPLSLGAALLVGGGVLLGVSAVQTGEAELLEPEARAERLFTARSNRVGGVMMLVAGGLITGIAAFLFWFEPTPRVSMGLTPIDGGAIFSVGWRSP